MTIVRIPHRTTQRVTQRLFLVAAIVGAAALSGCAAMNRVSSEVANFGTWPGDMVPGTYSFDRLPSQEANPKRQQELEAAASQALGTVGFKPAADGAKGDVTVQLGARIERFERSPWDDPLWMPGLYHGFAYPGPWFAPYGPYGGFGPYGGVGPYGPFWRPFPPQPDQYQREVALLIRDAATGKPLYETRATSGGISAGSDRLIAAMFTASLKDFPHTNDRAHDVTVDLPLVPDAH